MSTTKEDIKGWLERGKEQGASHMIVVCDTFDYVDYPVFVKPSENVREVEEDFNSKSMQRVMEVYNISMEWDVQLNSHRSFNY